MSQISSPAISISSIFIFSSLVLIVLILSSQAVLIFADAQLENSPRRPITSKVISSNYTAIASNSAFYQAIPLASKVVPINYTAIASNSAFYQAIPLTSSVVPSNFSAITSTISPSYTVTNATITFSYQNITGDVTKIYEASLVNSSHTIVSGSLKKGFLETLLSPEIKTIIGE